MFIVGRAIAGAGSSGIGNGAMTIISVILPRRKQAQFLGINMGIGQLGIALGPILGGAFTQNVSWRWCKLLERLSTAIILLTTFFFLQVSTSTYPLAVLWPFCCSCSRSPSRPTSYPPDKSSARPLSLWIFQALCSLAPLPSCFCLHCNTAVPCTRGIAPL